MFEKISTFYRNIEKNKPDIKTDYVDKPSTLKVYFIQASGMNQSLGEATFDLSFFIGKNLKNFEMPVMDGKKQMGKIKADIWVGSTEKSEEKMKTEVVKPKPEEKKEKKSKQKMPENFYRRVMEMEREIDIKKENAEEQTVIDLMDLYREAIMFCVWED